ncbi:MAG: 4Fe-4S dicluster domain-containing protein [Syntrophobacteraceae bacterium]|nr:4Fe-4S dicluster domain-containing protein [Desulfobacteraceae bacterium]
MPRYVMVVDQRRCMGCMACIAACSAENGLPPGYCRTRVVEMVEGEFPSLRMELRPELCNHCDDPPCVRRCPTGASYRAGDGTVQIDRGRCIGCKACLVACPYDARTIHPDGFADKCTFCGHRIGRGLEPACVANCLGGARIFGDLDDPAGRAGRLLSEVGGVVLLKDAGTGPKVFYLKQSSKPL